MTATSTLPPPSHAKDLPQLAHAPAANSKKVLLVIGAAIGMSSGFSALYISTLGIFLKPIASDFGWGRAQLTGMAVIAMLASAIAAPLIGKAIARFGAGRIIGVAIVLLAAGLFGMSQLNGSLLALGTLSFFLGFVGTATTPLGYLSAFPQHFERRLGLALGCAMIGVGLGAALAPIAAQSLVTAYGWRGAYQWLAGAALVIGMAALAITMLLGPDRRSGTMDAGAVPAAALEGDSVASALRTARFWLMFIALGLVAIACLGAAIHFSAILTDRGISPASAAGVAAVIGAAIAIGRFGSGAVLDYFSARFVAAASFTLAGLGLALIGASPVGTSLSVLACGAGLIGLALGAEGDLIPFLVRRYFGRKAFVSLYGCITAIYLLGGVLGPVLFGVSFDRTGAYSPVLFVAAAGCVLGAVLMLFLGPYRHAAGSEKSPTNKAAQ